MPDDILLHHDQMGSFIPDAVETYSSGQMLTPATYLALFVAFCAVLFSRKCRYLSSPPGPPRLPLIGNLHQIPKTNPWRTYKKWHQIYGPIITVKAGSGITIILGSHQVARDLLERRSSIYSSRPHLILLGDYIYGGYQTALLPYGSRWRLHHRIQAAFINIRTSQLYRILHDLESKQLLYDMLHSNDFTSAFRRYSSSLLFALVYGKRIVSGNEPEIVEIGKIMNAVLQEAGRSSIVEAFSILDCLPSLLAPWKYPAKQLYERQARLLAKHMDAAMETSSWNWCKQALELKATDGVDQVELSFILGNLYEASHTTAMVLEVFVMASVLHQDAVARAQEELDRVVGLKRLPILDDMPNLPFVDAFIREVLRWRPVTPGGMPHVSTQEDEYMGYHIPKGATIVANHWSLDLDEDIFEEPYEFKPQRWIENPKLPLSAFGFGRRVCPGRHIGHNTLFSVIARLLWAYRIDYAYENGTKLEIDPWNMTQGSDSQPMPFKASFRPRSPKHQEIIEKDCVIPDGHIDAVLESIGSNFK